jgi:type II secretory pathway component PulK
MPRSRGSVIIIVLWTIAIASIIVSSVQLFAYRQATIGREALDRIQARWAARAGLENTIATITRVTEKPEDPDDAKELARQMWVVDKGQVGNAEYTIVHHSRGRDLGGPADEHAKFNLNNVNDRGLLLAFDDVTLDVLDAIGDWMDEDDEPGPLGVERDFYLGTAGQYEPRNGALRTLGEVELIAGIWPRYFRGEDWNLNSRLDPSENDGSRSFPHDEPDSILQAGWSENLTVYSVANGASRSGQPRLWLPRVEAEELMDRIGVNQAQADALISFGKTGSNQLSDLLFTPLAGAGGGQQQQQPQGPGNQQGQGQGQGQQVPDLTESQLRAVLGECSIANPKDRLPGKMNLNTVSVDFLRDIFELLGLDEGIADEIIYRRDTATGIASLVDLKSIPSITTQDLRQICQRFDVVSNVFTITSRGRSLATGIEVEIVAVVDRSTLPVRIIEYREQ